MQVFSYSGPEFNPYNDGDLERRAQNDGELGPWLAPTAVGPLSATVALPGSKSLTNRELVLSALADGPSILRAPLHSRDTALMIQALRSLGTSIAETDGGPYGPNLLITPGELAGGTSIEDPPGLRDAGFGKMYLAYLRDPDGNKLCGFYRVPADA